MRSLLRLTVVATIAAGLLIVGCQNLDTLTGPRDTAPAVPDQLARRAPAPSPLVTVDALGQPLTFWPYIGTDLESNPHDPISLIFIGQADPRQLRAALLSLDGDRTAFGMPDAFPFNCVWRDCMGDVQAAYGEPDGWVGNAIQLECGDFSVLRFHLRFFRAGNWTLGSCHFEFLIPGTHEHQVLSWELAEQFVMVDFIRGGFLDPNVPMIPVPNINESPWSSIPPYIYNELPIELRALIGGPLDDVTEPVPIWNDGNAVVLNVVSTPPVVPVETSQNLTIDFNQVIPKPFCSGGEYQYVYVLGPIYLNQTVSIDDEGKLTSNYNASGYVAVTPVDPTTDPPTPLAETYYATIRQEQSTMLNDGTSMATSYMFQSEDPQTGPYRGQYVSELQVGPGHYNAYSLVVECEP